MQPYEKFPAVFNIDKDNYPHIKELLINEDPCTVIIQIFTLRDITESAELESTEEVVLDQNDLDGGRAVYDIVKKEGSFESDEVLVDSLCYQVAQEHRTKQTVGPAQLAEHEHKLHMLCGALYKARQTVSTRAYRPDGEPTTTGTPKVIFVAMVYHPGRAAARSVFIDGDIRL